MRFNRNIFFLVFLILINLSKFYSQVPCSGVPPSATVVASSYTICPGTTSSLSLANSYTISGILYQWYSSTTSSFGPYLAISGASASTLVTPTLNTSTWFRVVATCTSTGGSSTLIPASIQIAASTVTVSNTTNCSGLTTTLNASASGTINWFATATSTVSLGAGLSFVTPTLSAGNYTYYAEANSSCTFIPVRTPLSLTIYPSPTLSINNGSLCSGNSVTLTPGGAQSYTFINGGPVVSPTVTTSYSVTGTSSLGCIAGTQAITTITVHTNPVLSVNGGSICSGQTFTINPSGAQSYSYQGGSALVNPSVSTSYSVIGTSSLGCVSNSILVNVFVYSTPTITASNGTVCLGNSFVINPIGANSYTYSSSTATVSPTSSSSFVVQGSNVAGCISNTLQVNVQVVPLPTVSVNSGSVCAGGIYTIIPFGASSYSFSSGSNTFSTINTTTFSVVGTSSFGCLSASVVGSVGLYALPNMTITGSNGFCAGVPQNLQANGALSYTWSSGAFTPSISVSPLINTTYTVIGTDANSCQNIAIKTIIVHSLPTLSVSGTGTVCEGLSASLLVSGTALTYTWSNGSNGNLITVVPLTSTAYTVIGTDINGCSNSVIHIILVNTAPPVMANANTTQLCLGNSATLYGSGASTYTWTGGISNNIAFYPSAGSNYTVTGIGTNGCKNSATIQLVVNPLPIISITSNATGTICNGDQIVLSASGGNIYSWSGGQLTSSIAVSPGITNGYTVTGIDANGCSNAAYFSQVVIECNGIKELASKGNTHIYPNPNSGIFVIETENLNNKTVIEIVNLLGEIIYEKVLDSLITKFELRNSAKGVYLVRVYCGEKLMAQEKLVITE